MIINPCNSKIRREEIIQKIKDSSYKKVINVGGSLGANELESVTHYADLQQPQFPTDKKVFVVDISNSLTWNEIILWTKSHGKFEYSICSQTLEHVPNVNCALLFLSQISNQGFINVPSKYTELKKGVSYSDEGLVRCNMSAHFRGFLPHRWIFTVKNDILWAFPKLNFIEFMDLSWVEEWQSSCELSFEWENEIPFKEVNDILLDFPDPESAIAFYYQHLQEGL